MLPSQKILIMNNWQKEMYALQDSNGDLIGLDLSSGGYPWVPDSITGVWTCSERPLWIVITK